MVKQSKNTAGLYKKSVYKESMFHELCFYCWLVINALELER